MLSVGEKAFSAEYKDKLLRLGECGYHSMDKNIRAINENPKAEIGVLLDFCEKIYK